MEMPSVSRQEPANVDTQDTAQRMLALLLDVLGPSDALSLLAEEDLEDRREPSLPSSAKSAPNPWNGEAENASRARLQLQHLLNPADPTAPSKPEGPAHQNTDPAHLSLEPVDEETGQEALEIWLALSQISDRLGPGQLAAVERQTDLQALPREILQAIEMHLDDDRLSSFGKVLRIGHLLLGQSFPSQ